MRILVGIGRYLLQFLAFMRIVHSLYKLLAGSLASLECAEM